MKTLNFLDDFWIKAKKAIQEIEEDLPKVAKEDILKPVGKSIWVIQYKDLGNSWSVENTLKRYDGKSKNLITLCEKIKSVFEKSPDKVVEFIKSTENKGYFKNKLEGKRIVLTPNELARLRLYIKENL